MKGTYMQRSKYIYVTAVVDLLLMSLDRINRASFRKNYKLFNNMNDEFVEILLKYFCHLSHDEHLTHDEHIKHLLLCKFVFLGNQ